jgi:hypothetical protein
MVEAGQSVVGRGRQQAEEAIRSSSHKSKFLARAGAGLGFRGLFLARAGVRI